MIEQMFMRQQIIQAIIRQKELTSSMLITDADLSNPAIYESGHWYTNSSKLVIKAAYNNRTRLRRIYAVKPNTTYQFEKFGSLNWLIRLCSKNPGLDIASPMFISTINKTNGTFTTPSNCDRIAVSWMTEATETTIQRIKDGEVPVIKEVV